jgi:PEGA domain
VLENSTAASHDDAGTPPRAPVKAQVIHLDSAASKNLSMFGSEQQTVVEHKDAGVHSTDEPHSKTEHTAAPPARGSGARGVLVTLLVLTVVAQGGFIARELFWASRAAVGPEAGTLSVTSEPVGAAVRIDGTARGVTPLQIDVAPGPHTVEVGTGAQARTQSLTITRGGTFSIHQGLSSSPTGTFEPGMGGLLIATEPPGARVSIDGASHGVSPVTVMNLKVGDHVVTVRGNSGADVNRTVSVSEAIVSSLMVSMTPSAGFASGWLALSSTIPLQIVEKGTIIGTTDSPRILLPTGTHELELVNAELGYRTTRSVQVAAGQTATVALKAPQGAISINAVPWAEVWVDSQPAGETPIGNFSVAIGKHELVFRHPDLGEQRRSLTVGLSGPARISVDMRKK